LTEQDPAGNIGLLFFRLVERIALKHAPEEWPIFAPHAEALIDQHFNPRPRRAARKGNRK
jgi:hypothetical protein